MVKAILEKAGFVLNKTYRETRFLTPPKDTTYAVYMDSKHFYGSDKKILLCEHSVTIELYEYAPDPEAEARIEDAIKIAGIEAEKYAPVWINEQKLYQVVYEFDYISKGEKHE